MPPGLGSTLGQQAEPLNLKNAIPTRGEDTVGPILIKELDCLRQSLFELHARISGVSNYFAGAVPTDPVPKGEPRNILEALGEINAMVQACHRELSRTANLVGL